MAVQTIDELFSWTDLTSDGEPRSKLLTERGGDVFLVIHHAFNRKVQDTIALSKPGGRTVSMSSAIGPTVAGAVAPIFNVQVVKWNSRRPWTTASSIDDKAYTVETSNVNLNHPYPVAMDAKRMLAKIAAALHVQTGMPLDSWHILDHATVFERGWGSYPTACCGEDLRNAIPWIIAEAKRIVAGGNAPKPPTPKEIEMAMTTRYVMRDEAGYAAEFMLVSPDVLPPLKTDPNQDGYRVTADVTVAEAYNVIADEPALKLPRKKYIRLQEVVRELSAQMRDGRISESKAAHG